MATQHDNQETEALRQLLPPVLLGLTFTSLLMHASIVDILNPDGFLGALDCVFVTIVILPFYGSLCYILSEVLGEQAMCRLAMWLAVSIVGVTAIEVFFGPPLGIVFCGAALVIISCVDDDWVVRVSMQNSVRQAVRCGSYQALGVEARACRRS